MAKEGDAHKRATVALVVHPTRPEAAALAGRMREWWETRDFAVVDVDGEPISEDDSSGSFAFVVSLGGDGTMLRAVHFGVTHDALVLGVNLGTLAYLTEVEPEGMEAAFERVVAGDFKVDERMVLDVRVDRHGEDTRHFIGLNDAAIERSGPGRTVRLRVSIAGRPFLSYVADGVLVASPTGSTAYNFSLRGPIVSPDLRALILTPVSPHMLFDRSLVLDPDEPIRLELDEGPAAILVVDGASPTALAHDGFGHGRCLLTGGAFRAPRRAALSRSVAGKVRPF